MQTNVDNNLLPGSGSSPSSVIHNSLSPAERFQASNIRRYQDNSSFPNHLWKNSEVGYVKRPRSAQTNLNNALAGYKGDTPDIKPFDICRHRRHNSGLDISLRSNMESCTEMQRGVTEKMILKPGMVLLKRYLSHKSKVELVRICHKLSLGPGGFYQPGYKDGARNSDCRLCVLVWAGILRPENMEINEQLMGVNPQMLLIIKFRYLTNMAIEEAQNLSKKKSRVTNVEDVLPSMSPDICIVNFYTDHGSPGLHQDRDESRDSLRRRLPVLFCVRFCRISVWG